MENDKTYVENLSLSEARTHATNRFMNMNLNAEQKHFAEQKHVAKILIPPCTSGNFGLDTSNMYSKLDKTKQYHHTVQSKPTSRDGDRSARRTDVIVEFFKKTSQLIRVDFDLSTGTVLVSLNPIKKSLLNKKAEELRAALETIMKTVSTKPYICF